MGARPGFSFVDTAKFRAEDCTDGSWEDITLRESRDQPGDAGNAIAYATRQRVGRSYITTAGPSPVCLSLSVALYARIAQRPGSPCVFTSTEEAAEADGLGVAHTTVLSAS